MRVGSFYILTDQIALASCIKEACGSFFGQGGGRGGGSFEITISHTR